MQQELVTRAMYDAMRERAEAAEAAAQMHYGTLRYVLDRHGADALGLAERYVASQVRVGELERELSEAKAALRAKARARRRRAFLWG